MEVLNGQNNLGYHKPADILAEGFLILYNSLR